LKTGQTSRPVTVIEHNEILTRTLRFRVIGLFSFGESFWGQGLTENAGPENGGPK